MAVNGSSRSQANPPPAGIYVPVPTFFAAEGSSEYNLASPPVDIETQTKHSLFLVQGGIKVNALPENVFAIVNHRIAEHR